MIRLTWRQFRTQGAVASVLLVAVAILFIATRGHVAHIYSVYHAAQNACIANPNCPGAGVGLSKSVSLLELIGTALVVVPALIGAFWGAPLIAREFENGTHRLAWTQSVTRTRWLATKLAVVGLASIAATGLLSLLVTWWSSPIDTDRSDRFSAGMFGERNIAPLGYAAFAFALGVVAGVLIKRTLPAMFATLFAFLATRIVFTLFVRQYLMSPARKFLGLDLSSVGYGTENGGQPTLITNQPNIPGAWIYSTHIVNKTTGQGLTAQIVKATCPSVGLPNGAPNPGPNTSTRIRVPAGVQSALQDCLTKIGASYHQVVTYQPANRYWTFQWYETAVFFAAALALAGFSFWWIRRRAS
jgi:ABC-type transport system involved in multi-copper enzyme maturation permease subunit